MPRGLAHFRVYHMTSRKGASLTQIRFCPPVIFFIVSEKKKKEEDNTLFAQGYLSAVQRFPLTLTTLWAYLANNNFLIFFFTEKRRYVYPEC